jgi:hypothetical protein
MDTRLTPKHPPGRSSRKARAFEAEISRLYAEGYSCEAIRVALADAGVCVSASTVWREVARHGPPADLRWPAFPLMAQSPEAAAASDTRENDVTDAMGDARSPSATALLPLIALRSFR